MRKIVIIAGSNRTGTSLLAEILIRKGFCVPDELCAEASEYQTYESQTFRELSRRWNTQRATDFVDSLDGEKIVLKYPKASYVLGRWLKLIPDARVIYVYRPREEAVESQLKNWWQGRPFQWIVRWIYRWQWYRGYWAMSNLSVPVRFVTFEELKRTNDFVIPASFGWDEDDD